MSMAGLPINKGDTCYGNLELAEKIYCLTFY